MKLLIFDLDGTIIDSAADLLDAINFGLINNECGKTDIDYLKEHIGEPLEKVFEVIAQNQGIKNHNGLIKLMVNDFIEYSQKHLVEQSKIFDGLEDFLAADKSQIQVIATTKPSSTARKISKLMNFEHYFDNIYGSENIPPKPDPCIINNILKEYNIVPDDAVMIGDTDKDMLAGKSAGIKTCLALWGYGNREEALKHKPDFLISRPTDLSTLINFSKK